MCIIGGTGSELADSRQAHGKAYRSGVFSATDALDVLHSHHSSLITFAPAATVQAPAKLSSARPGASQRGPAQVSAVQWATAGEHTVKLARLSANIGELRDYGEICTGIPSSSYLTDIMSALTLLAPITKAAPIGA